MANSPQRFRPQKLTALAPASLLIAMTMLVYLPSTQCGFIWDDDAYVQNNPLFGSAEGLGRIWFRLNSTPKYYPLVFTTYWIEHGLWGLNPAGFHTGN